MDEHLGRWNLEGYKRVVGFTFEEVDPELLKILIGCDMEEVVPLSDPNSEPTEEKPRYEIEQYGPNGHYMITCDEGWRRRIVCVGMYKHVADWLLAIIQGQPMPDGQ